jgi:hypothetical protein
MSVINLAAERTRRALTESEKYAEAGARQNEPAWKEDIHTCCAYARMLRAEHDAETERIRFDAKVRGLKSWNEADDLKRRVDVNWLDWYRYQDLLRHIAAIPATTRGEASDKRHTIGKQWLAANSSISTITGPMRNGCLADDHLFPPSLKLARKQRENAR